MTALFGRKFWGVRLFFPHVPLAPGDRDFLCSTWNPSKCQGAALGQKEPKNPVFCDFLPLGVRSVKTQSVKKLRGFREKLLGVWFFYPKVPLAPGNCVLLFLARARNFTKCPPPKTGQNTTKSPFPTSGGPTEKKVVAKKVAENHPG